MLTTLRALLRRPARDPAPETPAVPAVPDARLARPPALAGRALALDPPDSLGLAAGGNFEPAETALCQALVGPGERCLDVGANIGYFTLLLARLNGPDGPVTAVEPNPLNADLLARNCAPEVAAGRVRVLPAALGAAAGTARLYRSKDNGGMHRLYPSVCCQDAWDTVAVHVGDALGLAPLDFVKIDIEGYEPAALAGLTETLRASPRVRVMAEFSPLSMMEAGFAPTALVRQMADLGLRPWVEEAGLWAPVAAADLAAQAAVAEAVDLPAMTAPLRDQGNAAVAAAAVAALTRARYARPLLETVLWVADAAMDETRRRLAAAGLAGGG